MLSDDLDDAVGGAAQGERIPRTAGLQTESEHSGDGVGLVGNRSHGAFQRRGHIVVHRFWLVMMVDRVANGVGCRLWQQWIELLDLGVKAADDALKLGKFLDQL